MPDAELRFKRYQYLGLLKKDDSRTSRHVADEKVRELRFFRCQVIGYLKHGATGNFPLISDDGSWLNPALPQLVAITTATPPPPMGPKFYPLRQ